MSVVGELARMFENVFKELVNQGLSNLSLDNKSRLHKQYFKYYDVSNGLDANRLIANKRLDKSELLNDIILLKLLAQVCRLYEYENTRAIAELDALIEFLKI